MASSNVGPSLNTLPLFDKMDKLDLAKTDGKGKVPPNAFEPSPNKIRSPIEEPKRGDLTSRLQKEFGLLVDNDTSNEDVTEDIGDTTPEATIPAIVIVIVAEIISGMTGFP